MEEFVSIYLFISFLAFFAVVFLIFLMKNRMKVRKITFLEILSLLFVIVGIIYDEVTAFGYAMISAGVVFFVADFYLRMRKFGEFTNEPKNKKKK